jgi:hypothetical protein
MIAALCRSVNHDTRAWGWIKLFIALQCIISLCSCEFYQFPAEATWLLISSTVLICIMASLFLCLYSLDFSVSPIHNSWHTKLEPHVVVAEASTYLSIVSSSEFEGWYHSSWWIGTCAWKYLHVIDLQRLFFWSRIESSPSSINLSGWRVGSWFNSIYHVRFSTRLLRSKLLLTFKGRCILLLLSSKYIKTVEYSPLE